MIAATQRAKLVPDARGVHSAEIAHGVERPVTFVQHLHPRAQRCGAIARLGFEKGPRMRVEPDGHVTLDPRTDLRQRVRKLLRRQRCPDGNHAAADVDADRCRNDGTLRCDHAADRRPLADMDVRHDRDRSAQDRQVGKICDLRACAVLDGDATGPQPYVVDTGGQRGFHGSKSDRLPSTYQVPSSARASVGIFVTAPARVSRRGAATADRNGAMPLRRRSPIAG